MHTYTHMFLCYLCVCICMYVCIYVYIRMCVCVCILYIYIYTARKKSAAFHRILSVNHECWDDEVLGLLALLVHKYKYWHRRRCGARRIWKRRLLRILSFTGTKVQILTQKALRCPGGSGSGACCGSWDLYVGPRCMQRRGRWRGVRRRGHGHSAG